jgi:hypothetical protein
VLTPERIATVPGEIIHDLALAVTIGDIEAAHLVVDRVGALDERLAAEVRALVRAYRFEEILGVVGKR